MNEEFRAALANAQDAWRIGKMQASGVKPERGVYKMQLMSVEGTTDKTSNGALLIWKWLIKEGQYSDATVTEFMSIKTPFGAQIMCERLIALQSPVPDSAEDIENICAALNDKNPTIQAELKYSDDFPKITIKSIIGSVAPPKTTPKAASVIAPKAAPKISVPTAANGSSKRPALFAFLQAHEEEFKQAYKEAGAEFKLTDSMTEKDLTDIILQGKYTEKEHTAEEVALLKSVGATFN